MNPIAPQPAWAYGHRGYALFTSLRQMTKSRPATLLTLLVLGITMALPAVFLFTSDDLLQLPVDSSRGQSMTVYLTTSVGDLDGAAMANDIAGRTGIASIQYISRQEALDAFLQQSEFAEAMDILESNPLPGAVVVYPGKQHQSRDAIQLMAAQLKELPGVDSVQFDLQWVTRLSAVMALIKTGSLLLVVFLITTALIVIANTLRLEMLQRTAETQVTQLLGATRRFVSRPYLYLGALYGFLGGVMAITLAIVVQLIINPPIHRLALAYGSQFQLSLPSLAQTGIILATTISLGLLGAVVTVFRRFRHMQS